MADLPVMGLDCKAYYNTGTNAIPVWVEIADAIDVSASPELSTGTIKTRSSTWAKVAAGLFGGSINIKYLFGSGTVAFDTLRTSFFAKTIQQYAIFDGIIATSGQQGLLMYGLITTFPFDQPLEDMSTVDMVIQPAYFVESGAVIEPSWQITT